MRGRECAIRGTRGKRVWDKRHERKSVWEKRHERKRVWDKRHERNSERG